MTGMAGRSWCLERRAAIRAAAGVPSPDRCWRRRRAAACPDPDKVIFQTDWRAQAEHGGYYQAIAAGSLPAGRDRMRPAPGGPSLNISQLLLAGRVDMIMSNSFEAFTYVREDARSSPSRRSSRRTRRC